MAAPSAIICSHWSVKTSHVSFRSARKLHVLHLPNDKEQLPASRSTRVECQNHCQIRHYSHSSQSQKLKFACGYARGERYVSLHAFSQPTTQARAQQRYLHTGNKVSPLSFSFQDESLSSIKVNKTHIAQDHSRTSSKSTTRQHKHGKSECDVGKNPKTFISQRIVGKEGVIYESSQLNEDEIKETDFNETGRLLNAQNVTFSGEALSSSEQQGDVVIVGNARRATDTYRKRVERKALKEDTDTSNAATVAARIRKELEEKEKQTQSADEKDDADKKKSRNLRHQTQDLSKLQESTVAAILKKSVIYNQGDIVAIDKPYGIPSHGGPGVTHNIDSLLPILARNLAKKGDEDPRLHLVHRLDKETTGVMVLAKTEHMLRRLQAMFRHRKVTKKYWVITVGIPDPPSGVIDMPMAEAEIANRFRMVVKPDLASVHPGMKKSKTPTMDAITNFKVLDSAKKCALVELEAMTGVKHQIRVHLAQGMGCTILGDHKYSHFDKQAPQRLPYSMLLRLDITQPKVRTVPMHLHAQSLILPEFFDDGRNLIISSRLPKFFAANLKKLKMKVP